jgi:ABC-type branched-subunit amino acid transport system permease subunit
MSYFWTLILMFVGLGIYIMGWYTNDSNQKKSGTTVMKIGLVLFIIFGAFFEMIFSSFSGFLFPALLIVLGAYIILARSGLFGGKKTDSADPLPPSS